MKTFICQKEIEIELPALDWPGDGFVEWFKKEWEPRLKGTSHHTKLRADVYEAYQAGRQSVRREPKIYNKALNDEEVKKLYNKEK